MNRLSAGVAFGAVVVAALAGPVATATARPAPAPDASTAVVAEQSRVADAAKALGLSAGQGLSVKAVVTDPDGSSHVRYERT